MLYSGVDGVIVGIVGVGVVGVLCCRVGIGYCCWYLMVVLLRLMFVFKKSVVAAAGCGDRVGSGGGHFVFVGNV